MNSLILKQSGVSIDQCTNRLPSLINDIYITFDNIKALSSYLDKMVWGNLLQLLIYYLTSRKKRIVLNGQVSDWA